MKVMLVEDEALNVLLMKKLLRHMGYDDVHAFSSGEKALDAYPTLRPDVVLMDIQLAGSMDGIETTVSLKKILDRPVIYTTGYGDLETRERADRSGAAAFLLKPISQELLREAMSAAKPAI